MLPELGEIAKLRGTIGLTQNELARAVGVKRSLIAKLETGRTSANYKIVKEIFDFLEGEKIDRESKTKTVKVGQIHNTEVEYADASEPVHLVWDRMNKKAYSQLPVKDTVSIVGSITERAINRKMMEIGPEKLRNVKVVELMEEPFPIVSVRTSITNIIPLLQAYQAVITSEKGKPVGIITNADILDLITEKRKRK